MDRDNYGSSAMCLHGNPALNADGRTSTTMALASILPSQIIPIEVERIRYMLHGLCRPGIVLY